MYPNFWTHKRTCITVNRLCISAWIDFVRTAQFICRGQKNWKMSSFQMKMRSHRETLFYSTRQFVWVRLNVTSYVCSWLCFAILEFIIQNIWWASTTFCRFWQEDFDESAKSFSLRLLQNLRFLARVCVQTQDLNVV